MMNNFQNIKIKTGFEVNDEIIEYDVCRSGGDVQEAIEYYHAFDYIASSYIYYVNGVKHINKDLFYFFRFKSDDNIKLIRKLKLKNIKTI